ncbi:hypothetical protein AB4Y95_00255 [Arthrobacter sp. M-10]|uniref:hypothetical protein n=1 Tax=Arthrobacter sp. M-10 TaxID=3233037 RepID=UPI003F8FB0BF
MTTNTNWSDASLKPSNSGELEKEIRATVLRPLADKFQELTRQIDSGEYRLPKTIEEAEAITEGYINQAWERLTQLHEAAVREALQAKLNDLNQAIFYESANPKGQFVKDLIMVELDKLEDDRIAAL